MSAGSTIAFALVYVTALTLALGGVSAAPWLPTKKRQREHVAGLLPLEDGDLVYDLGCGDGSVLFELARRQPGIMAVGYEVALLPYVIGIVRKLAGRGAYDNVSIRCRDFFRQDISDADIVFIFLFRDSYPKVLPKLVRELRDDALVVVEAWPFPGISPERVAKGTDELLPVYFYRGSALRATA
jgi:SAM-dependent methyltransferase